jgi:TFIIH basal transcription factor complex TTD-A subunit
MPKAIKGITYCFLPIRIITHLYLLPGVLIECDPSIKAIILKIDSDAHDYIVEDLDDQTLVIKESQLQRLKARLEKVCLPTLGITRRWRWSISVLMGCLVGVGEHAADAR